MQNNLAFWTGVVEDRNDPLKLGRVRVRIFGYHTEDLNDLPVNDLPWAMPLQSVTSAAISGVGSTPIGIVTGTWVMGFFLDGEDAQKPVILGTIAGSPKGSSYVEQAQQTQAQQQIEQTNVLTDGSGNIVRDGSGEPILTTPSTDPLDNFGNLKKNDVTKLLEGLGKSLSDNNYRKEEGGKLGKYQFSYLQLVMMGYAYRPGVDSRELNEELNPEYLEDPANWTGKSGITSKQDFLNKFSVQENAMVELLDYNYRNLTRLGKIKKESEPGVVAGLLASAHYGGYSNADKLGRKTGDQVLRDAFVIGAQSVLAQDTDFSLTVEERNTYLPDSDINLFNEEFGSLKGFEDPNKQYPKAEYLGQSDINKLALGNTDHPLFAKKENNKVTEIPKARTSDTWEEPDPVFGAAYPFNQVIETEAGHVIELDSTKGAERIHVYHKSGAYFEIDPKGTMVRKAVGDDYEFVGNNDYLYVKGAEVITIEGKTRILVKDQAFLEVEGGLSVTSNKNIAVQTAGILALIADKLEVSATNGMDFTAAGPINIQGTSVTLNATDGSVAQAASKGITHTAGEDFNISSGRHTRMQAGSEYSVKSGEAIKSEAGKNIEFKAAQSVNMDAGGQVNIRMGLAQPAPAAQKSQPQNIPRRTPPPEKTPASEEPDPLDRDIKGQDSFILDDDPDGSEEYIRQEIAKDRMSDKTQVPKPDNNIKYGRSPTEPTSDGMCDAFRNLTSFQPGLPLSTNFRLGDLVFGRWTLKSQSGLPPWRIVCNLKNLANNVLEPLKSKYPNLIITNALRNLTDKFPNEKSDHLRGCAVDVQFLGMDDSDYRDAAVWIQQNIPYKQLLLEYEQNSEGKITKAWIHISFEISEVSGAPIPTGGVPVATFVNHAIPEGYANRLIKLG